MFKPKLNGGLYTGEEFKKEAPWANIYIKPTTAFINTQAIEYGNTPPPGAKYHFPSYYRPGNNDDELINEYHCIPKYNCKTKDNSKSSCELKIIKID